MIDINCRLATSDMFERTTHQELSPKCGYDFPVISCNYIIVTKTRIEWSFHNLPTVLKQVAEHPNTSQLRKIPVQKTAENSKIWENTPAGKPKQALQCKKAINFLSFFLQYVLSNSITFLSTSPYPHQSSRKCVTTLPSSINWLVLSTPLKNSQLGWWNSQDMENTKPPTSYPSLGKAKYHGSSSPITSPLTYPFVDQ